MSNVRLIVLLAPIQNSVGLKSMMTLDFGPWTLDVSLDRFSVFHQNNPISKAGCQLVIVRHH